MSNDVPERELTALEAALKGLTPAASPFNRDQLFFRAGQASVRTRRWVWPSTAGLLAAAVCTLGTLLAVRPEPQTIERVVYIREKAKEPAGPPSVSGQAASPGPAAPVEPDASEISPSAALPGTYLRLRAQVLRWGVETLPATAPLSGEGKPLRPTSNFDQFN